MGSLPLTGLGSPAARPRRAVALWSLLMWQTQERHQVTLPRQATCSLAFEPATASQEQGGT
jgi:hypothetical protein